MGGGSEKEKHRNRAAGKSHLGKRHKGDIRKATVSQGWDRDHKSYPENTGVLSQ